MADTSRKNGAQRSPQKASENQESEREGFPGVSASKEFACNAGDLGLIPGLGRSPGEGNGNPLQYSGLENSMDREGACQATDHGVAKNQRQGSEVK